MPPKRTSARPAASRTLSAAHKRALAEGRSMSATVDRYLTALNAPRRRGRKVNVATLEKKLALARKRLPTATGLARAVAAQEIRDLKASIAQHSSATGADFDGLEAAFLKVAKQFGARRGISYGAWRDAGVPADILRRAGVLRTAD